MKSTLLLAIALASSLLANAETFLGVTSATNRLLVTSNEALVIHKFFPSRTFQVVKDGAVYNIPPPDCSPLRPAAVAGPCEFILTNNSVLNFRRLPATGIQTIVVAQNTTNSITVPNTANIRFFAPLGPTYSIGTVRRGATELTNAPIATVFANEEYSGPLEFVFVGEIGPNAFLVSYILLQEAQVLQQQGLIQTAPGQLNITVEKSYSLTNWVPSIMQEITNEEKAYYRLRITK